MNKILELLEKAGCKPELAQAIGDSLEDYKTSIQEQFEADYAAKVSQAKKICIEETDSHKRELARRLQIFLETKSAAIESHLIRQSAISESEATSKLKSVRALVDGIKVNGTANDGATLAVIENAKKKIKQLTEERNKAIAKANRQNAIAEKVLRRNRKLVSENSNLKSLKGGKTVTEGRSFNGNPRRLDSGRTRQRTVTTRPTILENQTRRAPVRGPGTREFGVNDIAAKMDEIL